MTDEQKLKRKIRRRARYLENREAVITKSLKYYYENKQKVSERISKRKKEGKFCKCCEVKLNGLYWGLYGKNYCSDCRVSGRAKLFSHRTAQKRYKLKIKNQLYVKTT